MVVKEKRSLVNLKAIAIILECFLYWTMDFKVGWSMFPDNGSNLLKFYTLANSCNLVERQGFQYIPLILHQVINSHTV